MGNFIQILKDMHPFLEAINPFLETLNFVAILTLCVMVWQVRLQVKSNVLQVEANISQTKANTKQLNAQSYIAYTERYESVFNRIPLKYWEKRNGKEFQFPENDDELKLGLHGYYQLCCQQFYLHHHSMIDVHIWKMWQREIEFNLSLDSLYIYWKKNEEGQYFHLYPEFNDYVNNLNNDVSKNKKVV